MGHNQNQKIIQETKKGRSPRELVRISITRSDRCLSDIDQSQVVNPNFEFQQKREELWKKPHNCYLTMTPNNDNLPHSLIAQ